jgi:hypothetical protein
MPVDKFKLVLKGKAIENPYEEAGPSSSSSSSALAPPKKGPSSMMTRIQLHEGGERLLGIMLVLLAGF